jgi:hypothetical protein
MELTNKDKYSNVTLFIEQKMNERNLSEFIVHGVTFQLQIFL